MQNLITILHKENCSLVIRSTRGAISLFSKKGVRDLVWLLDNLPSLLYGSQVADKVVGKAAAGLMVRGGVKEVYGDVMSRLALPLLDDAGITYSYGELTDKIIIADGDTRCPLEEIVQDATSADEVESLLRHHFSEMQKTNKSEDNL